jgi:hypothetical protein
VNRRRSSESVSFAGRKPEPGKRNRLINTATAHSHSITSTKTIRQRNTAVLKVLNPQKHARHSHPKECLGQGHAAAAQVRMSADSPARLTPIAGQYGRLCCCHAERRNAINSLYLAATASTP